MVEVGVSRSVYAEVGGAGAGADVGRGEALLRKQRTERYRRASLSGLCVGLSVEVRVLVRV